MARQITLDFKADWITYLKNELQSIFYPIQKINDEDIPLCYFNLSRRLVNPTPRLVLKSKEFTCPQNLITGLSRLEDKIIHGEILWPHLSRSLNQPSFNDGMLNHWGIHHLHLGCSVDKDGFIERSDQLLFIRFDETTAYLIDIRKHGAWTEQEFLCILHRNWPESLAAFKVKGLTGERLSDKDIEALRKNNGNVIYDIDGTPYLGMGGGVVASGTAIDVWKQIDYHLIRLEQFEEWCRTNKNILVEEAAKIGRPLPFDFELKIVLNNGDAIALEPVTGVGFTLGRI